MTPLAAAFDNISLMRRKLDLAMLDVAVLDVGPRRDAAIARIATLKNDLVRGLQDFAALGFEAEIANLIAHQTPAAPFHHRKH